MSQRRDSLIHWFEACLLGLACGCATTTDQPRGVEANISENVLVGAGASVAVGQFPLARPPAAALAPPPPATVSPQPSSPPQPPGYLHEGPALSGMRLQLTPGQTATDRAVELARKLEDAERDKQVLSKRIAELDATVASRNRALEEAGREVLAAREELMRSRAELEGWQQEMQGLREKLRSADKENLATLQATVSLLQHMLGPDEAPSEK